MKRRLRDAACASLVLGKRRDSGPSCAGDGQHLGKRKASMADDPAVADPAYAETADSTG